MAFFDNLEDVRGKFADTICYYGDRAVYVKNASLVDGTEKDFTLSIHLTSGSRSKSISLKDPSFRYKDFCTGYANQRKCAAWWFRRPLKQYHQGLRANQLGFSVADQSLVYEEPFQFGFHPSFVAMLENKYPPRDECAKMVRNQLLRNVAFHRDFAISWDPLHEDYILEYRGNKVGVGLNNDLTNFRLLSDQNHLREALHEAIA